jgi:biopolymer transport protein ExbB/TolQ
MLLSLAQSSPLYAFQQSDGFGRFIVVTLFAASILAWSILVEKWIYLRRQDALTKRFLKSAGAHASPLALFLELETLGGPMRGVAQRCLTVLGDLLGQTPEGLMAEFRHNRIPRFLSPPELERLHAALEEGVDEEIHAMEARLGLLGTIVSASPFLGLLGTVWGVMMAFTGMAMQGKADIGAIAPGVSGALLTTVVGLLVAIPALFGFNAMTNRVRRLTVQMDNFAAAFSATLKTHFLPPEDAP